MERLTNTYLIERLRDYLKDLKLHDKDDFALENLISSLEDNIKEDEQKAKDIYNWRN